MLLTALHVIVANVMLTTTLSVKNHYHLLMNELRLGSVKALAQGCQTRQWQSWDLDPRGWL